MNQRERVLSVLNGEKPDRVPWFADLDYYTTALIKRGERSDDFKTSREYIEWHKELRAGFYLQGYFPFKEIIAVCTVREWKEGNKRFRSIETPNGTLSESWQWSDLTYSEAPVERLVKTANDLPAYRFLFEHTRYEPEYELALERRELVNDIGVVLCYTPRSPFMHLTAIDAGIENIMGIYMEAPDAFAETLAIMKKTFDNAVEIAAGSPAEILMIPENLSSEVVGPNFFERFMKEYQSDWVERIHGAGKFSTIHPE